MPDATLTIFDFMKAGEAIEKGTIIIGLQPRNFGMMIRLEEAAIASKKALDGPFTILHEGAGNPSCAEIRRLMGTRARFSGNADFQKAAQIAHANGRGGRSALPKMLLLCKGFAPFERLSKGLQKQYRELGLAPDSIKTAAQQSNENQREIERAFKTQRARPAATKRRKKK